MRKGRRCCVASLNSDERQQQLVAMEHTTKISEDKSNQRWHTTEQKRIAKNKKQLLKWKKVHKRSRKLELVKE